MNTSATRLRRWIPVDEIGVRFNLSPRLVRHCLGDFKRRANSAVAKAVREERLVRPETCSQCNSSGRIEGHHPDYLQPLQVVWLCRPCHRDQPSGVLERVPLGFVKRWVAKENASTDEWYLRRLKPPRVSTMGSRIAGQRTTLNRSVLDVATELGMNEAVLALWESDQAVPTLREAVRLARELNASMDYIFEGKGAP